MATQQYLTLEDFLRLSQPMRLQYDAAIAQFLDRMKLRFKEKQVDWTGKHAARYHREFLESNFIHDHYQPGEVIRYLGCPVMVESINKDEFRRLSIKGKTAGAGRLTDITITQPIAEALVWNQYLETAL